MVYHFRSYTNNQSTYRLLKPMILLLIVVPMLTSCVHNRSHESSEHGVDKDNNRLSVEQRAIENRTSKPAAIEPEAMAISTQVANKNTQLSHISQETQNYLDSQIKQLETSGSLPIIKSHQAITPGIAKVYSNDPSGIEQDIVQLDYEQVELRQILQEIADSLGISIVIDASVNNKVTMRTAPDKPLKYKDLWPLLNMLLSESGITLENKAGVYYAKKSPVFLPEEMGYATMLTQNSVGKVMQITPLRNISIQSALAVLKPLIASDTKISQIAQLNALSIIASSEQLKKINGLLSLIDVDPFRARGIRIYKIQKSETKKVAADLIAILKLIEGAQPAYQVLGLERINSLLVVAPPGRGFTSVDRWVDILDDGGSSSLQEQIFFYRCKSIDCDSLSGTLNSILNNANDKKPKIEKELEASSPNVFRTVPKDALAIKRHNKPLVKKKRPLIKNLTVAQGGASANIMATIVSDMDSNSLLIRTTARDYQQLLETIKVLDRVPLQVLVNVVIAQVTLSDSQSLGLDWSYLSSNGSIQTNFGVAQNVSSDGKPLGLILNRLGGDWRVTLNAVAKDSNVNILSRPSLLISNNQEGAISVGKEVPVQTSETTNLDSGTGSSVNQVTQQIAYRKTGIEMTITPHINDDGVINMQISQSLSSIEGATNSSDAGFKPTFGNQEITTTVIARNNQTIILGGLIESVTVDGETGIPIIKNTPIVGSLFKTQTEQTERRELVLIITPKIISPETDLKKFNHEFNNRFDSVSHYLLKQLKESY